MKVPVLQAEENIENREDRKNFISTPASKLRRIGSRNAQAFREAKKQ
jgi:hypothetical protein